MDELIIDYRIIVEPCYLVLQSTVFAAMQEEWQPFGGVAVCEQERVSEIPFSTTKYHERKFLQAMVKYED